MRRRSGWSRLGAAVALLISLPACRSLTEGCPRPSPPPTGRFCGAGWCTIDPAALRSGSSLAGVVVFAANDAWAVGTATDGSGLTPCPEGPANLGPSRALIEHWNGRAWSVVPNPAPTSSGPDELSQGSELTAVGASGPDDIWTSGRATGVTFFEHWNGAGWTEVPAPDQLLPYHDVVSGIASISPIDAWAAVHSDGAHQGTQIVHWNGQQWALEVTPNGPVPPGGGQSSEVTGILAFGPDDVWAVGSQPDEVAGNAVQGSFSRPLAIHFDGTNWRIMPTQDPHPGEAGYGRFEAVGGSGPNDVWAVGTRNGNRYGAVMTLIEHWDGHTWRIVPSPNHGGDNGLAAVAATNPGEAWAVGASATMQDSYFRVMILRWDGTAWHREAAPDVPTVANYLHAVAAIPGGGWWAVGDHQYVGAKEQALILRRT